jgi:hypothetical protein
MSTPDIVRGLLTQLIPDVNLNARVAVDRGNLSVTVAELESSRGDPGSVAMRVVDADVATRCKNGAAPRGKS